MNEKQITHRLSTEAREEFREIYKDEFRDILSDDQVEEMGMGLLGFFHLLKLNEPIEEDPGIEVTENEYATIKYIHTCLFHHHKQPTVRGVTEALGKRSSRSGFRVLTSLMKKKLVWRDDKGELCMVAGYCKYWGI